MNINQILEAVAAFIASIGGAAFLIGVAVRYSANQIADRLQAKYQLKLEKELEWYKARLDGMNYISKLRFEKEFLIYQKLSEAHIAMVFALGEAVAVARGMYNGDKEKIDSFVKKVDDHYNTAQHMSCSYAPFISKDIFDKYRELERNGRNVVELLGLWLMFENKSLSNANYHGKPYTKSSIVSEIEVEQKKLSALSDEILEIERKYLSNLDNMEAHANGQTQNAQP